MRGCRCERNVDVADARRHAKTNNTGQRRDSRRQRAVDIAATRRALPAVPLIVRRAAAGVSARSTSLPDTLPLRCRRLSDARRPARARRRRRCYQTLCACSAADCQMRGGRCEHAVDVAVARRATNTAAVLLRRAAAEVSALLPGALCRQCRRLSDARRLP